MKMAPGILFALQLSACMEPTPTDTVESQAANAERLKELRKQCKTDRAKLGNTLCNAVAEATRRRYLGDGRVPYTQVSHLKNSGQRHHARTSRPSASQLANRAAGSNGCSSVAFCSCATTRASPSVAVPASDTSAIHSAALVSRTVAVHPVR